MSAQHTPIPEIIYLQWYGDENPECLTEDERQRRPTIDEVSWCWERIFDCDIEYIQLAKYKQLEQQRDELKAQNAKLLVRNVTPHEWIMGRPDGTKMKVTIEDVE